ncbi:hypothetical protein FA13DRAFT_1803255 [Coprinellus micaceus]|uniref:Uncharacterized protein n=1 Tax=Coprinellus micaceus TaxID=71717 RepID=A0A4Y7SCP7_COPMI|nr:hypothetical protein FA13DRAFT_1803255 [Coprinellus micaceus]
MRNSEHHQRQRQRDRDHHHVPPRQEPPRFAFAAADVPQQGEPLPSLPLRTLNTTSTIQYGPPQVQHNRDHYPVMLPPQVPIPIVQPSPMRPPTAYLPDHFDDYSAPAPISAFGPLPHPESNLALQHNPLCHHHASEFNNTNVQAQVIQHSGLANYNSPSPQIQAPSARRLGLMERSAFPPPVRVAPSIEEVSRHPGPETQEPYARGMLVGRIHERLARGTDVGEDDAADGRREALESERSPESSSRVEEIVEVPARPAAPRPASVTSSDLDVNHRPPSMWIAPRSGPPTRRYYKCAYISLPLSIVADADYSFH